jgi:hypothetical protein
MIGFVMCTTKTVGMECAVEEYTRYYQLERDTRHFDTWHGQASVTTATIRVVLNLFRHLIQVIVA